MLAFCFYCQPSPSLQKSILNIVVVNNLNIKLVMKVSDVVIRFLNLNAYLTNGLI
jgi:hypothetical protein